MKELDLNDLSTDAQASVKAVLSILTGYEEDVHIYEGERYLYTIHKAAENEIEPGIIRGTYQPGDKPGDALRAIRENVKLRGKPSNAEIDG